MTVGLVGEVLAALRFNGDSRFLVSLEASEIFLWPLWSPAARKLEAPCSS